MMNILKRSIRIFACVISVLTLITLCLCFASSDNLEINTYNLITNKNFNKNDFTCLVVADYHHRALDFENINLIDAFKQENNKHVDAVFYVGDLIDDHTSSLDDVHQMFQVNQEYHVAQYFVSGNHEQSAPLWPDLKYDINNGNFNYVNNLNNNHYLDANVDIYGLEDPKFYVGDLDITNIYRAQLDKWTIDSSHFNILLVHRPMYFSLYSEYGFDLVVAGHVHGGQIKIGNLAPSLNGYCSGLYKKNNSTMIVSRGLGYAALLPIRVNCNPEIVKIKISK